MIPSPTSSIFAGLGVDRCMWCMGLGGVHSNVRLCCILNQDDLGK